MKKKEEEMVEERARDLLERYLEIETDLELRPQSPIPPGYPVRITDIQEVEQVAVNLRQEWGLGKSSDRESHRPSGEGGDKSGNDLRSSFI